MRCWKQKCDLCLEYIKKINNQNLFWVSWSFTLLIKLFLNRKGCKTSHWNFNMDHRYSTDTLSWKQSSSYTVTTDGNNDLFSCQQSDICWRRLLRREEEDRALLQRLIEILRSYKSLCYRCCSIPPWQNKLQFYLLLLHIFSKVGF